MDVNYSIASEEDVNEFLFVVGSFVNEADKGNEDAIANMLDFERVLRETEDCDIVREYYNIQTGKSPMTIDDYEVNPIDVVAKRLKISKTKCNNMFCEQIKNIIDTNNELWYYWFCKNYKDKYEDKSNRKPKAFVNSCIPDEHYKELDYNLKHGNTSSPYTEYSEYPDDLKDLIKVYNQENNVNLKIGYYQDIVDLKKHYGIKIEDKKATVKTKICGYTDKFEENVNEYQFDDLQSSINEYNYNEIINSAYDNLTEKQFKLFHMYYMSGFTMDEIAKTLNMSKQNVSKGIKLALDNINKDLF